MSIITIDGRVRTLERDDPEHAYAVYELLVHMGVVCAGASGKVLELIIGVILDGFIIGARPFR
jgi:hypothetical protein